MNAKQLFWSLPVVAAAVAAGSLVAPSAEAGGGRVRLDFTPGEMSVAITGEGRGAANYYLPYTLSNPMDEALTPRLYLELATETGKTYGDRGDAKVTAAASKAAKGKEMASTSALRAKPVAVGASVNGVANFGSIDPNADDLTVKVYGLWDPIVRTRQGKVLKETRVLVMTFARNGDEYDRPMDPIRMTSKKEVVEGDVVELYSTTAEKAK